MSITGSYDWKNRPVEQPEELKDRYCTLLGRMMWKQFERSQKGLSTLQKTGQDVALSLDPSDEPSVEFLQNYKLRIQCGTEEDRQKVVEMIYACTDYYFGQSHEEQARKEEAAQAQREAEALMEKEWEALLGSPDADLRLRRLFW